MKTIILTRELLHKLSTHPAGNGFTKRQIMMMGFDYPPRQGWLNQLVGLEVPQEEYDKVYHAGDALRKKNLLRLNKLSKKIGLGWVSSKSRFVQPGFQQSDFTTS